MCTSDCKCYEGANGETKKLWTGYGDTVLMPYLRNDLDSFEVDEHGNFTYPFIWTDDPDEAFTTFRDCYNNVIKPKDKYISSLDEYKKSFYDDGGYLLLKILESQHESCASICEPPLFYLTRDVSLGMPDTECILK